VGRPKTKPGADWRDGFLFLGNQLALDFLNTRPVLDSEPVELLADFGALLRWFRAADLISPAEATNLERQWGDSGRAKRALQDIRELRERLRKEVITWERGDAIHPTTVDTLNRLMAEHAMLTRLKAAGRESSTELYFAPRQPEDLLAPLAHSAATLFARVEHTRIRKCAQCVLHFLDTSKKGTRRWCSMQLCGNRHKVAAYAARQRTRLE